MKIKFKCPTCNSNNTIYSRSGENRDGGIIIRCLDCNYWYFEDTDESILFTHFTKEKK